MTPNHNVPLAAAEPWEPGVQMPRDGKWYLVFTHSGKVDVWKSNGISPNSRGWVTAGGYGQQNPPAYYAKVNLPDVSGPS